MAESILVVFGKLLARLFRLMPATFDDAFRIFFRVITNLPVPILLALLIVWSVVAFRLIQLRLKRSRTPEPSAVHADDRVPESDHGSREELIGMLHEETPGLSTMEQAGSATPTIPPSE